VIVNLFKRTHEPEMHFSIITSDAADISKQNLSTSPSKSVLLALQEPNLDSHDAKDPRVVPITNYLQNALRTKV
jgi:hypothetical protein